MPRRFPSSLLRLVVATPALLFAVACGSPTDSTTGSGTGESGTGGLGGSGGISAASTTGTAGTGAGTGASTTTGTGGAGGSEGPCAGTIDLSTFTPEWHPSSGLHQNQCDATQINDFFDVCVATTGAPCDVFVENPDNALCVACLVTGDAGAPEYGPFTAYLTPNVLYENPGQCLSVLEGNETETSCGAKVASAVQCTLEACALCVNVSFDTLVTCLNAAEAGDCKPLFAAKDACIADLATQGVPVEDCVQLDKPFLTFLKDLMTLGCGP